MKLKCNECGEEVKFLSYFDSENEVEEYICVCGWVTTIKKCLCCGHEVSIEGYKK